MLLPSLLAIKRRRRSLNTIPQKIKVANKVELSAFHVPSGTIVLLRKTGEPEEAERADGTFSRKSGLAASSERQIVCKLCRQLKRFILPSITIKFLKSAGEQGEISQLNVPTLHKSCALISSQSSGYINHQLHRDMHPESSSRGLRDDERGKGFSPFLPQNENYYEGNKEEKK